MYRRNGRLCKAKLHVLKVTDRRESRKVNLLATTPFSRSLVQPICACSTILRASHRPVTLSQLYVVHSLELKVASTVLI